jgi:dTDP-glucose 4,6-dehydratase
MKRSLVTGGCGFIGSALVRHLIDCGIGVVNLDALTYAGTLGSVSSVADDANYVFVQGDVNDRALVQRMLAEYRPTSIFHLAAESHVDRSIDDPLLFVRTNVSGTATMLDAALGYYSGLGAPERKAFRFVHVSTDEVFGSLGESGIFNETTPYDPSSPYSASKAGADHLARAWHRTFGLPVIVTNCSNNYGPFQFPEKFIPLVTLRGSRGETLPVYGSGNNVRDWLFVEDHVRALALVAERGEAGETYCISGQAERRNIDVVRLICDLLDRKLGEGPTGSRQNLIRFVEDRPGHDLRYAIDSRHINGELGWRPKVNFEEGLARTIDWYLANRNWWLSLLERHQALDRAGLNAGKSAPATAPSSLSD